MWLASVRFGYLFGGLRSAGNLEELGARRELWSKKALSTVVAFFEEQWAMIVRGTLSSLARAPREVWGGVGWGGGGVGGHTARGRGVGEGARRRHAFATACATAQP